MRAVVAATLMLALSGAGLVGGAWAQTAAPGDRMLGTWTCVADSGELKVTLENTYLPSGRSTFSATISGATLEAAGTGSGYWKILSSGRLEEDTTQMTIATGKLNGQPMSGAQMKQLGDSIVAVEPSQSTVTFPGNTMVLADDDGLKTTCTR